MTAEALVEHTGGGVHTIYVGPVGDVFRDGAARMIVGPWGHDGGYLGELYLGADDNGDDLPKSELSAPTASVGQVIELMAVTWPECQPEDASPVD